MAEARHTAKFDFAKHEFEVDGSPVHLTTLDALYVKYLAGKLPYRVDSVA